MIITLVKTAFNYLIAGILIACLVFLDLHAFETFGHLIVQTLLVVYIVTIFEKPQHPVITIAFIAALALESLIFFSHVSYGLFIALFLLPLSWVLTAWIHTTLIAAIAGLLIALTLQQCILWANQALDHIYFLTLIGHFCINTIFLCVYRIFEKNGKQGNRS